MYLMQDSRNSAVSDGFGGACCWSDSALGVPGAITSDKDEKDGDDGAGVDDGGDDDDSEGHVPLCGKGKAQI